MIRRFAPILLLLLSLTAPPARVQAQTDDLKALKALFDKDPPAGFDKAARLFEEPRKKGDLEGNGGYPGRAGGR